MTGHEAMPTGWTSEEIELAMLNPDGPGTERLRGFVNRPFAVHEHPDVSGWSVTHLPTGWSLINAMGLYRDAWAAMAAVDAIRPVHPDWEGLRPTDLYSDPAAARALLKRVRLAIVDTCDKLPLWETTISPEAADHAPAAGGMNGYGEDRPA